MSDEREDESSGRAPGARALGSRRSQESDAVDTGSDVSPELESEDLGDDGPSTTAEQLAARLAGDEAELFLAFNRRLVRWTHYRVNTSPDIVEDACAFAWIQFMRSQPDRDRNWQSWLLRTAEREAWRLHRQQAREHYEPPADGGLEVELADPRDPLTVRVNLRHALDLLAAVPERRRQAKALHVMGFTFDEIAEVLEISRTRVNQLVAEANAAMRREQLRIGPDQQPRTPRAARLRELEERPPRWLCAAIGAPPGKSVRAEALLAWRRAALAIDDYRRDHAPGTQLDPLRERPSDARAGRAFDLAMRAAERARSARQSDRDRSIDR